MWWEPAVISRQICHEFVPCVCRKIEAWQRLSWKYRKDSSILHSLFSSQTPVGLSSPSIDLTSILQLLPLIALLLDSSLSFSTTHRPSLDRSRTSFVRLASSLDPSSSLDHPFHLSLSLLSVSYSNYYSYFFLYFLFNFYLLFLSSDISISSLDWLSRSTFLQDSIWKLLHCFKTLLVWCSLMLLTVLWCSLMF